MATVRSASPKLAMAAALLAATLGTAAQADTITLESFDGSIRLTGELIEFDGINYRLDSLIGEVVIEARRVQCTGEACPPPSLFASGFTIAGSEALASRLIPALVEGFSFSLEADMVMASDEQDRTTIALNATDGAEIATVALAPNGSTNGLRDLLTGDANLAVTTRPVGAAEVQTLERAGLGNLAGPEQENVLALDGLIIVTAPENPVRAITEESVARIFAGQITNWAEIGGPNAPIALHVRDEGSGGAFVFNELVLRPLQLALSPNVTVHTTDAAVSDAVAADPLAIGFTSFSNQRGAKSLAIRGVCGIQTPVNAFTIKTEEYPLTRRLFLYKPSIPLPPSAEDFVAFVRSAEAQAIVSDAGFVDQGVSALSVNEQGLRFVSAVLPSDAETTLGALRTMMQDLVAADRMSITFRFESGTARLDSRAEADIERLAQIIASGALDRKEILLIGFTDSVGRADLNSRLSELRASQVLDALRAALPGEAASGVPISVRGYGELSPLGCNETIGGRRINRRVEVWTRDLVGGS